MASMDLIFRFLGVDAGAGAEFDRMAGRATGLSRGLKTAATGATIAAVGIAAESVKMAASFQTAVTKIHTQANASNAAVGQISKGILAMAGAVAETPDELADAAYHIASVGQKSLTTAQQLNILKIAAEGAKIGGANLVDVTNALDAAVVSGIKGVSNYSQTMGVLNATVGAGDMQMQDLADAFGPLGAVLKGYNVNIRQAGAALAVFGDNNLRGAQAGTQLRMAVQALVAPVQGGATLLQSFGIKAGNLAAQMRHGGLTEALDVLMKKMRENGITAKEQGDVLTQAFGKRAGVGLNVLEGELDRYHNKLKEVSQGATGFASSWAGYTKTFSYNLDAAKDAGEALLIQLGTKLLPVATRFMHFLATDAIPALSRFGSWLRQNAAWTKPLAVGLGALVAVLAGPVYWITAFGVALVVAYKKSQTFRNVVHAAISGIVSVFETLRAVTVTVWHAIDAVWQGFVRGPLRLVKSEIGIFTSWWRDHSQQIKQVTRAAWDAISGYIKTGWHVAVDVLRPGLTMVKALFKTAWGAVRDVTRAAWQVIADVVKTATHTVLDVIGVVLDLITGKWGKAWSDARKLVSDSIHGIGSILKDFGSGAIHLLYDAGRNIVQGLINGIKSLASAPVNVIKDIGHGIVGAAKSVLSIFSPSKVFHEIGVNVVQGLNDGMNSKASDSYRTMTNIAHRLYQGLSQGWRGMADRIKNLLTTPVQNALAHLQTVTDNFVSKQQAALKKATDALKQDLQARRSDIQSLAGTISQGADLSGVFGTDANGNPTVGNAQLFLAQQVGPLRRFAHDLAAARRQGLNRYLLGEIANLGPIQGDQVLRQFIGNAPAIQQANRSETLIRKYSNQAASTAENAMYQGVLQKDRAEVHKQTDMLRQVRDEVRHLRREGARDVARHIDIKVDKGGKLKLSDEDARVIVKALRQLDRRTKITAAKRQ